MPPAAFLLDRSASSRARYVLEPVAVAGIVAVYLGVNSWHGLYEDKATVYWATPAAYALLWCVALFPFLPRLAGAAKPVLARYRVLARSLGPAEP